MTDILAGATVKAVDRPAAVHVVDNTNQTNVTSTTFVTGSPVVDTTFTAPTSGKVMLVVGGAARDDAGADSAHLAPEIYEGTDATGTLVVAADDGPHSFETINVATRFHAGSRVTILPGLTPGATHYIRLMHRVTAGNTVDIAARELAVIPAT